MTIVMLVIQQGDKKNKKIADNNQRGISATALHAQMGAAFLLAKNDLADTQFQSHIIMHIFVNLKFFFSFSKSY